MRPDRPPKRWIKLRAVADLMQVPHPDPHYRVQFVRRLLRRLEKRDGTAYLRRFGAGKTGNHWHVSPEALEALEPHNPAALGKLREDIDATREDQVAILRKVNDHGSRIRRLEEFKRKTAEYLASVADL